MYPKKTSSYKELTQTKTGTNKPRPQLVGLGSERQKTPFKDSEQSTTILTVD